jgi:hypothetical protein
MKPVKKFGFVENALPSDDDIQKIYLYMKSIMERYPKITTGVVHDKIDEIPKVCYFNKPARRYYSTGSSGFYSDTTYSVWKYFLKPVELFEDIRRVKKLSKDEPVELDFLGLFSHWVFKGIHYYTEGPYTHDEFKLLILDEFDKERKKFESLRQKFGSAEGIESSKSRPRIPEQVRIEVWRRDSGKCARCGSRENLEYDHIVPISRGGSNTARNIELLCEKCNRTKHNNIA